MQVSKGVVRQITSHLKRCSLPMYDKELQLINRIRRQAYRPGNGPVEVSAEECVILIGLLGETMPDIKNGKVKSMISGHHNRLIKLLEVHS